MPLLSFGSKSLKNPWGIARDPVSGNIVVASLVNHTVCIYSSLGTFRKSLGGAVGNKPGSFCSPIAVAVDSLGNILVADYGNHRIQQLTSAGAVIRVFGKHGIHDGEFRSPRSIAVDAADRIFVVDQSNQRVQIFDPQGVFLSCFGSKGRGPGELRNPSYITIDHRNGNIFVSDSGNDRVQAFDPHGVFRFAFGRSGEDPGCFSNPLGLCVDCEGKIIVVDHGNNRVQIFASDGSYLSSFPLPSPDGIVVDRSGALIISSQLGGVHVFGSPPKFSSVSSSGMSSVSLAQPSFSGLPTSLSLSPTPTFHARSKSVAFPPAKSNPSVSVDTAANLPM